MNLHLAWLWLWFLTGVLMYMLKRAYFMVTGPNKKVNSYTEYFQRAWVPLLVRAFGGSMIFWALFVPGFSERVLGALGWTTFAWLVAVVTQWACFAGTFGFLVDSVLDFIFALPGVNKFVPQMPSLEL